MYTRTVTAAPEKIVKNGRPVFGTFNTLPKKLDVKGLATPFWGIPIPPILARLRIRARSLFVFSFGDYVGTVDFFDSKILNMAEFTLWNPKRGTKYVYRNFLGARKKLIPTHLEHAQILSPSPARHIRLSWNHPVDRLSLKVNVRGFRHRPQVDLFLTGHFSGQGSNQIVSVKPAPTTRRCSASWFTSTPLKGRCEVTGTEKTAFSSEGSGILYVNRAYYKFFTRSESVTAAGTIKGRQITLRLSCTSLDSAVMEQYNDNVLFADGKFTPLPPVCITHPFGINRDWTIQDYQSMVDLEFTPQTSSSRKADFILVKGTYDTVFGFLNGTLLDSDGNKIELKDFPAVAKRNKIRL